MIYRALELAEVDNPAYGVKVGDTKVDMEAADNAHMPGVLVTTGTLPDKEAAEAVNEQIGREHLIVASLVNVIEFTLDETLSDRIRTQNR